MDYLQYQAELGDLINESYMQILNLIINGLPSIPLPKG